MKLRIVATLLALVVASEASAQTREQVVRIPAAGGKVLRDRLAIPPHGFIGIFQDSEGNTVGLHSMT